MQPAQDAEIKSVLIKEPIPTKRVNNISVLPKDYRPEPEQSGEHAIPVLTLTKVICDNKEASVSLKPSQSNNHRLDIIEWMWVAVPKLFSFQVYKHMTESNMIYLSLNLIMIAICCFGISALLYFVWS